MFSDEMVARGVKTGFADLIISPEPPFHFHTPGVTSLTARGQHDSLADEAQHIASLMWGKSIKKGYKYSNAICFTDFAPTMARLLGINAPLNSTGEVLYGALDNINQPREHAINFESEDAIMIGKAARYGDAGASGGTAVSITGNMASLEFPNVPAADRMVVKYAAADNGKMSLYVNDKLLRDVFFPASGVWTGEYDDIIINITLNQGDEVKFVNDTRRGCAAVNFDCISFRKAVD